MPVPGGDDDRRGLQLARRRRAGRRRVRPRSAEELPPHAHRIAPHCPTPRGSRAARVTTCGSSVRADVRPRIDEDLGRSAVSDEHAQITSRYRPALVRARVELAVAVRPSATFAKAVVRVRVDNSLLVEERDVAPACLHRFATLEQHGTDATFGKPQCSEQTGRPGSDHDHRRAPARYRIQAVWQRSRLLSLRFSRREDAQPQAQPRARPAGIDHAASDLRLGDRVGMDVQPPSDRGMQSLAAFGVGKRDGEFDVSGHRGLRRSERREDVKGADRALGSRQASPAESSHLRRRSAALFSGASRDARRAVRSARALLVRCHIPIEETQAEHRAHSNRRPLLSPRVRFGADAPAYTPEPRR